MRRLTVFVLPLAAGAIVSAPAAWADDPPFLPDAGTAPADVTITDLQSQGYQVVPQVLNGDAAADMSLCAVTSIDTVPADPDGTDRTAYVNINCPSTS
jgi:hypothetical protein